MSKREEKPVEVTSFSVEYRLDATVQINGHSWAKPGVSAKMNFDGVPSSDQLKAAHEYLTSEVVEPLLGDIVQTAVDRSVEAEVQMGSKTRG